MTLLLLAGTGEAKQIAWGLSDSGRPVVASLAGATRSPDPLPVPTRIGGFGGEAGFRTYVASHGITAVLDATHPFAVRITTRTARICRDMGLPYCHVLRPGWAAGPGDDWIWVKTPADVGEHIPSDAVVFLATGRQSLPEYAGLAAKRILARMIDPPSAPMPIAGGEFIIGRPPFSEADETALFEALQVSHLVVKDAGGRGGRAKLDAARRLGVPVILIARPAMPPADRVENMEDALRWVAAL